MKLSCEQRKEEKRDATTMNYELYLQHTAVPRQNVRIDGSGVNAHMDAQDVLKERHGGGVLPAFELPQLARGEHRHHQVPFSLGELGRVVDDVVAQSAGVVG